MPSPGKVVFVCLHGAAKSVIASSYFNQLSAEHGLNIRATAAGVDPEPQIPPHVQKGLLQDGLDVTRDRPRPVAPEELTAARRIVSFECDLGHVATGLAVERWHDVPKVSDGFPTARDAILTRVRLFLEDIERKKQTTP